MKFALTFLLIIMLSNCAKHKTVMICGDHVCVNNAEAEKYFEENLSLQVKILNKKTEEEQDLIELNLKQKNGGQREVTIFQKEKTETKVKTLSNEEINKIKSEIKKKKKVNKISKKMTHKKKDKDIKKPKIKKNVNKNNKDIVDICTKLEKCSIEEISKYLIKQGKKKSFPDITSRR
tara:strand:+ start:2002 stop:2532 length:531 start_codon:yes stop_codon:yes gene_type:complete